MPLKFRHLNSLLDEILFAKPGEMQEKLVPDSQWNTDPKSKKWRDAALSKSPSKRIPQYNSSPKDAEALDKLSVVHTRQREDAKARGISDEEKVKMAQRHREEREAIRPEVGHTWTKPTANKRALMKADIATNLWGDHDEYHAKKQALLDVHEGQNLRHKNAPDEVLESLAKNQRDELHGLQKSYEKEVSHRKGYGTTIEIRHAQIRRSILGTLQERRGALQAIRKHIGSLPEPAAESELNKAGTGRIQVEGRAATRVGEAPDVVKTGIAANHGKKAPFKLGVHGREAPELPEYVAEVAGDIKKATGEEVSKLAQRHGRLHDFLHKRAKGSLVAQSIANKTPALKGNVLNEKASDIIHPLFSPNEPDAKAKGKLASHLGYSPEKIDKIYAHQRHLGVWKDTDKGYQTIRKRVESAGKFFHPPPEVPAIKNPHLRKLGLGAGVVAGVAGASYLAKRLIDRHNKNRNLSSLLRPIRFAAGDPIPRFRIDEKGRLQGHGQPKDPDNMVTQAGHEHRATLSAARGDLEVFKKSGIAAGFLHGNMSEQEVKQAMLLHRSLYRSALKRAVSKVRGPMRDSRSQTSLFNRGIARGKVLAAQGAEEAEKRGFNQGQRKAGRTVAKRIAQIREEIPVKVRSARNKGLLIGAIAAPLVGIGGYALGRKEKKTQLSSKLQTIKFGLPRRAAILGGVGAVMGISGTLLRNPGRPIQGNESVDGKLLWRRSPIPFIRHYGLGSGNKVEHIQSKLGRAVFQSDSLDQFSGGRRVYVQRTKRNTNGINGRVAANNHAPPKFNTVYSNCEDAAAKALNIKGYNGGQRRDAEVGAAVGAGAGITGAVVIPKISKMIRTKIRFSAKDGSGTKNETARLRRQLAAAKRKGEDKSSLHDVATGAVEGGLGVLATDPLIKRVRTGHWSSPFKGGALATAKNIGIGGLVGGVATGAVGYGLSRFLNKYKQQNQQSSIHFDDGSNTLYPPPNPKKKRLTVAQDRYKKQIHGRELNRMEGNITNTAIAGGALGAVLHRPGHLGKSIGIGAGLGAASAVGTILATRKKKDAFGEKSYGAKRVERLPWQAGGLAAAGIAAHKLYKKITFAANDDNGQHWSESRRYKGPRALLRRGQELRVIGHRGLGLTRDVGTKLRKEEFIDARGRPRTPEWEKPWFTRGLAVAAIGGVVGGAALISRHSATMRAASQHAGSILRKVPGVKATEDFAHGVFDETKAITKTMDAKGKLKIERLNIEKRKAEAQEERATKDKKLKDAIKNATNMSSLLKTIRFAEAVQDWDIRDARGKSARIYAPGSQRRTRRPKDWHEKKQNQNLLWEGALAATGATSVGGTSLYWYKRTHPKARPSPSDFDVAAKAAAGSVGKIATDQSSILHPRFPKYGWLKQFKK